MCKMDILKHYGLIGDSDMMNFEERDESLLNLTWKKVMSKEDNKMEGKQKASHLI